MATGGYFMSFTVYVRIFKTFKVLFWKIDNFELWHSWIKWAICARVIFKNTQVTKYDHLARKRLIGQKLTWECGTWISPQSPRFGPSFQCWRTPWWAQWGCDPQGSDSGSATWSSRWKSRAQSPRQSRTSSVCRAKPIPGSERGQLWKMEETDKILQNAWTDLLNAWTFDIYLKLVMKILCKNSCVFENKHFSFIINNTDSLKPYQACVRCFLIRLQWLSAALMSSLDIRSIWLRSNIPSSASEAFPKACDVTWISYGKCNLLGILVVEMQLLQSFTSLFNIVNIIREANIVPR